MGAYWEGTGDEETGTASNATGWIVDPDDRQELFKHILFTEKYNFNYIRWIRYGHEDAAYGVSTSGNTSSSSAASNGENNSSGGGDNTNAEINTQEGYRGTFTDSKGRTYKEYKQGYQPWRDVTYWGGTIHGYGCGPTSLAIICTGYGINENPETIAKYMVGNTSDSKLSDALTNYLHLKNTVYKSDYKNKLKENLKSGRPVVLSTENGIFTRSSHIMAALSINDKDEVWVSNPNSGTRNGWVDIDTVVSGLTYIITIDQDSM